MKTLHIDMSKLTNNIPYNQLSRSIKNKPPLTNNFHNVHYMFVELQFYQDHVHFDNWIRK